MNIGVFPASGLMALALWLLSPIPQNLPTDLTGPRNSFTVAAESVIDQAGALDLTASDAQFVPQMKALNAAKENLDKMAEDDSERDAASAVNDLVFAVSACRIVAKGGAPTTQCQSQVTDARNHAMKTLNIHKSGTTWQAGPPS